MPLAETARLLASFEGKDGLTPAMKKMTGSLDKFDTRIGASQTRAYRAGQQIGTGIKAGAAIAAAGIGFLVSQVGFGLQQLSELEDATAATNAVIKSTGGVAGISAEQVRALAEQYENLNATIDDKVIQSAENVLLTFTKIDSNAFQPALEAALNLSTALGTDLQTSVIQVGKALNDPTKGITALRKAGVSFTEDQIKQIKALQKSGDLLGAQRIILKELGTEFGGQFAAKGKTATAAVAGIGDAVEDLQKTIATGLFPVIQKFLPRIREALQNKALLKGVQDLGDAIASLFSDQNIATGSRLISDVFKAAQDAAPVLQTAAGFMAEAIKTGVGFFRSLPPEIQALAVAGLAVNKLTGGLVTNIAGGLISAVISSFKGLMNVNAAVVNVNGGVGGGGLPAGGGSLLATLGPAAFAAVSGLIVAGAINAARNPAVQAQIQSGGGAVGQRASQFQNGAVGTPVPVAVTNVPGLFRKGAGELTGIGAAQDAAEKAQQRRNVAFNSNPTRADLRTMIHKLEDQKPTKANVEAIRKLQSKLDHRIEVANKRVADALGVAQRSIVSAIQVAAAQPIRVSVPVTSQTYINGRLFDANVNRYTTSTNPTAQSGV